MATYSELVGGTRGTNTGGLLRDWANRDSNVIGAGVVARCLDWGADECYRRLRVPTLELSRTITLTSAQVEEVGATRLGANLATFPVPSDFIELIYISKTEENIVYNQRVDNRSIIDSYSDTLYNSFTRVGNEFKVFGDVEPGDTLTIHYYRRLPALDALYVVSAANFNAQTTASEFLTASSASGASTLYFAAGTPEDPVPGTHTAYNTAAEAGTNAVSRTFVGNEAAHWLRDNNERVLVFGALMEIFNYLDEPETYQRYANRFAMEIEELNSQERRRDAMGGNTQVTYNGGGLL